MSLFARRFLPLFLHLLGLLLAVKASIAQASAAPIVLINEIMPRPNSGAEWVELYNPNSYDIDLSSWKIDDDTIGGPQTTISPATIIPANSLLVVTLSSNILNDTGSDAAQLLDSAGTVIDSHTYSSASAGQSFARQPDGGATWAKGAPSQGAWNSSPGPSPAPTSSPTPSSTTAPTNTALPTSSPTNTTLPIATAASSPTSTAAHTPTNAPIPTSTTTSTPANTRTNTPSATFTNTPAPTSTATNTSMPSNTPTASPTITPFPAGLIINEFLANPKNAYTHEWVELFNTSSETADLSSWQLDDGEGGSAPYTLPPGTILAPQEYRAFELPTAMLNNDGDAVRLLRPDSSVADVITYTGSAADSSRNRAADGTWYDSARPSPGAANAAFPTATSSPTMTATATPTATSAPTAAPSVVAASWATGVRLNEFLAYPKTLYTHEWVELFNTSAAAADLSGWRLDDGEGGSAPYTLPSGTILAPYEYRAFDLPAAMLNNDGDTLRLLHPDSSVADWTSYSQSTADLSQSRDMYDGWYLSAANTAGQPNSGPALPTPTAPPAPTRTPTSTRTPLPTRTPARAAPQGAAPAAAASDAAGIQLSEILPYPQARYSDEWIEITNQSALAIDLSGWALDDDIGGSSPYLLPAGRRIDAHGLLVVELPRALLNNSGDVVRLLHPDGSVADSYSYGQSSPDLSFCRIGAAWRQCLPTPRAPNQAEPTPSTTATQPAASVPSATAGAAIPPLRIGIGATSTARPASPGPLSRTSGAATAYAATTAGSLYRGLEQATPGVVPTTSARAIARPEPAAPRTGERGADGPIGMGAGLFLCVIGGALAGYKRIASSRRIRQPAPPEPAEEAHPPEPA